MTRKKYEQSADEPQRIKMERAKNWNSYLLIFGSAMENICALQALACNKRDVLVWYDEFLTTHEETRTGNYYLLATWPSRISKIQQNCDKHQVKHKEIHKKNKFLNKWNMKTSTQKPHRKEAKWSSANGSFDAVIVLYFVLCLLKRKKQNNNRRKIERVFCDFHACSCRLVLPVDFNAIV